MVVGVVMVGKWGLNGWEMGAWGGSVLLTSEFWPLKKEQKIIGKKKLEKEMGFIYIQQSFFNIICILDGPNLQR